ncbi:MAG: hypothetical protein Q9M89_04135 [Persephonella sp.]|nr:hypothetical protein [Persephonella sp.]
MNKQGEVEFINVPREKEYKKGNITISESKPFIGEDGKAYFIRDYIKPNGEIKTKILPYYDRNVSKSSGKKITQKQQTICKTF